MTSISELKRIREREGKKLKVILAKRKKARELDEEKERIIKDIRRIKASQMKDKLERRKKATKELEKLKRTGAKVSRKVVDFLYKLRGE